MKACGTVELLVQPFLTSTLGGGECKASAPSRFNTRARDPGNHRLGEPQGGSGHITEETNRSLLPNMER